VCDIFKEEMKRIFFGEFLRNIFGNKEEFSSNELKLITEIVQQFYFICVNDNEALHDAIYCHNTQFSRKKECHFQTWSNNYLSIIIFTGTFVIFSILWRDKTLSPPPPHPKKSDYFEFHNTILSSPFKTRIKSDPGIISY
jgi:hypothetical protein